MTHTCTHAYTHNTQTDERDFELNSREKGTGKGQKGILTSHNVTIKSCYTAMPTTTTNVHIYRCIYVHCECLHLRVWIRSCICWIVHADMCVCVFVLKRVRTNVIVFVCTVCVFVCVHSYWHPLVCLFCLRIYVMHTIYFCRISNPVSAFNNALFSSIFHWLVHFRFLRMQAHDWIGGEKKNGNSENFNFVGT